jgi:hypothetical protein
MCKICKSLLPYESKEKTIDAITSTPELGELHCVDCPLLNPPFFLPESDHAAPWFQKRLNTISDDVPLQESSRAALHRVLLTLLKYSKSVPEPDVLYSADGERVELSWRNVGLFVRPEYVVMFRPKLDPSEQWKFLPNVDDDRLAISTLARIKSV